MAKNKHKRDAKGRFTSVSKRGKRLYCVNRKCPYYISGWVYRGISRFMATCPKCHYKADLRKPRKKN